jgi:acetamidase/formamidase
MNRVSSENCIHKLQAGEPVAEVSVGGSIEVGLQNAFGRSFDTTEEFEAFMGSPDKSRLNHPCTGPILVNGADRTGSLAIYIRSLTADRAFQCLSTSTGLMRGEFDGRQPQIFNNIQRGFVDWNGILVRTRPSLGVLATLDDVKRSCGRCWKNGGNMDFPYLSIGSIVYLPVNHEEAQLAVGDLHLRQGHGELAGMALEADGSAILDIRFIEKIPYPVIDRGNWVTVIGWGGKDEDPRKKAVENAIDYFGRQPALRHWSRANLYQLLACADVIPGNLTGNVATFAVVIKKRDLIDPASGRTVFTMPDALRNVDRHRGIDFQKILLESIDDFDNLEEFHSGASREIRLVPGHPELVVSRLNPTVYSFVAKGPVEVDKESASLRATLDKHFSSVLNDVGVWTSTLASHGEYILMSKEDAAKEIEVVVKGSFIGSPKHTYQGMAGATDRNGDTVEVGAEHKPYVRFDWRIAPPGEDVMIPNALADRFINTTVAEKTALEAYETLKAHLNQHDMDLLDCCFFMSKDGYTICGEVSPDNLGGIVYTGNDERIAAIFENRDKDNFVNKLKAICDLLKIKY